MYTNQVLPDLVEGISLLKSPTASYHATISPPLSGFWHDLLLLIPNYILIHFKTVFKAIKYILIAVQCPRLIKHDS